MKTYDELIALIDERVNSNHAQRITGPELNYVLKEMLGYAQGMWRPETVENAASGIESLTLQPGVAYSFSTPLNGGNSLALTLGNDGDDPAPSYRFSFSTGPGFDISRTPNFAVPGVRFDEDFQLDPGMTYLVEITDGVGSVTRMPTEPGGAYRWYSTEDEGFTITQPVESGSWGQVYLGDDAVYVSLYLTFSQDTAPGVDYDINLLTFSPRVKAACGEIYMCFRDYPNILTVNTFADNNDAVVKIRHIPGAPVVRMLRTTICFPRTRPAPRVSEAKGKAAEASGLQLMREAAALADAEAAAARDLKKTITTE